MIVPPESATNADFAFGTLPSLPIIPASRPTPTIVLKPSKKSTIKKIITKKIKSVIFGIVSCDKSNIAPNVGAKLGGIENTAVGKVIKLLPRK